jgi:CDP-diacylglycerol--glycerol-3-phosphate 3-phosphatidyltransferase
LKEKFWNIPNTLTLYRLLVFPFILYLVFTKQEGMVAIFIAISLFTDWLDGIIARAFRMQTRIGAKLDSWADTGTYICAFLAIYFFKWDIIKPHAIMIFLFLGLWLVSYAVVFIKFKGLIGMHTYLSKITGYVQGGFLIILFTWKFIPWLFYACMCIGILALLEEIIIIFILDKPRTNVKGLYWVMKNPDL